MPERRILQFGSSLRVQITQTLLVTSSIYKPLRRLLPARSRSFASAKAGRQLPELGELLVPKRPPDGGADGAGVDRVGVALGLDLEPLFPDAFPERRQQPGIERQAAGHRHRQQPGIGRRCPPGIGRHGSAWGRPPLGGCGCQAGDLGLGGSGGLCLRLEKS